MTLLQASVFDNIKDSEEGKKEEWCDAKKTRTKPKTRIENWFQIWQMLFNLDKCKC